MTFFKDLFLNPISPTYFPNLFHGFLEEGRFVDILPKRIFLFDRTHQMRLMVPVTPCCIYGRNI